MRKYKIMVITPIIKDIPTPLGEENFYEKNASPDFEVATTTISFGPASIECFYDEVWAAPFVVEKAREAERKGYHGILVDCFMNPGVKATREVVDIPVVGAGEAAIITALMLGDSFTIIDVGPEKYVKKTPPPIVREIGVESRFASIRGIGIQVLNLKETKELVNIIAEESMKAVEEDGADIIVLGCTGLAGIAEQIELKIGVPVIDPALSALKMLEALVRMNLKHSRKTYIKPPEKERKLPV